MSPELAPRAAVRLPKAASQGGPAGEIVNANFKHSGNVVALSHLQ